MWFCSMGTLCAGVVIFVTYAVVQVTQVAGATASFDVYDSDNYPQVSEHISDNLDWPLYSLQCSSKQWQHGL